MTQWAEIWSLALTVAGIIWAYEVLRFWREDTIAAWKAESRTAAQWLILGIVISFAGSILDNLYWGVAWGTHYLGLEISAKFFRNGVWSNLPFRQLPLIFASVLHAYGSIVYKSDPDVKARAMARFKRVAWRSGVWAVVTIPALMFIKALLNG